ncbi:MAG: 3-hydroxyacyl-CoA dehydrogenase family protein [Gemmatimonadetes bacterium]|nr:3-hydroxyacyl-CoA dehydrogenase family protein [Gemmatimonadota bacterium]
MSEIQRVAVVGGGLMGSGIAQVCAQAGMETCVIEVDAARAAKAQAAIERSVQKGVERGKLSAADGAATLARVRASAELGDVAGCDLVIEAIVEQLDAKQAMWRAVDALATPSAIFATNTSALPVADQAAVTTRADRFVGLHFFSPVPAMPLVEVVRAITTSEATVDAALSFVRRIGKVSILAKDTPGFIVNLLLVPYLNDAVRAYAHGIASVADIDTGMTLGTGVPMGPLALCDAVGLDTMAHVGRVMFDAFHEARYATPPLIHRMVASGWLGRKSGLGFYDYTSSPPRPREIRG